MPTLNEPVGLGTTGVGFSANAARIAASPRQRMVRPHPWPDSATSCGLVVSLSAIDRFPLKEPVLVGVNVTEMVHEPPAARVVAELPWQKPEDGAVGIENGPVPVMVWLVMLRAELPVLVSVSGRVLVGCGVVGVILRLPNFKSVGINLTVPAVRVMVGPTDLVPSATDVAVMITIAFVGTVLGAAYVVGVPLAVLAGVIVPHAGEQAVPPCVSVQLTPWLLESLLTVAVNGVAFNAAVAFTGIIALDGDTETTIANTVICTEPC